VKDNMADVIDSKKIAMDVRVARARAGLSQKELAEKSGVCETTISFIENGKQETIRMSTLQKLAEVLGVDVGQLIE
jgi:transcriptional regulator with XRE-family HTH domain